MIRRSVLCAALFLGACEPAEQPAGSGDTTIAAQPVTRAELCESDSTPISEIQGRGPESPLSGQKVVTRGVVTLVQSGAGVFLQSEWPGPTLGASNGIFLASEPISTLVSKGDSLAATGTVLETGEGPDTLTALGEIAEYAICGGGGNVPQTDARLPLVSGDREAFEAMQVLIEQPLTITDVHDIRDGEVTVSALGVPSAPTETALPGEEARAALSKIHDWSLRVHHDSLARLEPLDRAHAGALINALSGVMGNEDGHQLLLADAPIQPIPQPRIAQVTPEQDDLRIASFNIYNYFNGDGRGGGFPSERGARSLDDFRRQTEGIVAAVGQIRPDILAVIEVENDGFGPDSAIESLRKALSESLGIAYTVARPVEDRVGGDAIAVGLLYRGDRVEAIGAARQLNDGVFAVTNRAPLAQVFEHSKSGTELLVVANHLKSKSYCPESGPDADQGDGQACWNQTRTTAAVKLIDWVAGLARATGVERHILLGDFNAYRMEDPVRSILERSYVELVEHQGARPLYSYIYRGMAGTLDYAFASKALVDDTVNAFIWHINAAFPYSTAPSAPWLRSSDHDPVVVDLRFNHAATSD